MYLVSGLLYMVSLSWQNLLGFWVCMELAGLMLLCGFFNYVKDYNRYDALLFYLLVSGVSSGLMFSGVMSGECYYLLITGFCLKVGMFPFIGWVLKVYNKVSWVLLYYLAVVSKVPMLYMPSVSGGAHGYGWDLLMLMNFFIISFAFWSNSSGVKSYTSLSSMGSSSVVLYLVVGGFGFNSAALFCIYSFFIVGVIYCFQKLEGGGVSLSDSLLVSLFVVGMPCSLAIIYKIAGAMSILGLSKLVILGWLVYSVSEQGFLFKFLLEKVVSTYSW